MKKIKEFFKRTSTVNRFLLAAWLLVLAGIWIAEKFFVPNARTMNNLAYMTAALFLGIITAELYRQRMSSKTRARIIRFVTKRQFVICAGLIGAVLFVAVGVGTWRTGTIQGKILSIFSGLSVISIGVISGMICTETDRWEESGGRKEGLDDEWETQLSDDDYEEYLPEADCEILEDDILPEMTYEEACAAVLEEIDFSNVTLLSDDQKNGADILAEKDGKKYAVKCIYSTSPVNTEDVRAVLKGKQFWECDAAAIMARGCVGEDAVKLAQESGVEMWTGSVCLEMFEEALKKIEE